MLSLLKETISAEQTVLTWDEKQNWRLCLATREYQIGQSPEYAFAIGFVSS